MSKDRFCPPAPIKPVAIGVLSLSFIVCWTENLRVPKLLVGFKIGREKEGRTILVTPDELMSFTAFQRRALETGVFVGGTKESWMNAIAEACRAGADLNPDNPPSGFMVICHPAVRSPKQPSYGPFLAGSI